ncbi:MAG: tRNA (adenosine(37)-N6)-threonylcarbamoyltransferase complex dimerization subunit type 1 TsaB, partial [Rhodoglobus sp.]
MLLAIDTSAGTSVAVVNPEAVVLAEQSCEDTRRHAEVMDELIAACMAEADIAVTALTGVVAGMGPGPFTGLRVGIAAARAFALGAGVPVFPVVSHDAIAFGASEPILVVTDARRREVYWSTYVGSDAVGLPIRIQGPALAAATGLAATVEHIANYRLVEARAVSAGALGMLAATLSAQGRAFADSFDGHPAPLYLR